MDGPTGAGGSDTQGCQGGGQGVVNMTALDGPGNAEATGLPVNLWTARERQHPQYNAALQLMLNMIPLRKGAGM